MCLAQSGNFHSFYGGINTWICQASASPTFYTCQRLRNDLMTMIILSKRCDILMVGQWFLENFH